MRNYFTSTCIILLLFWINATSGQSTQQSLSSSAIDSMRIELERAMAESHIPGLMIAIANRDSILYSGGLGYSNLEKETKVTNRTAFRFASVTKMFTALAIQKLIAEGRFRLDDPLKKIAPEIPYENPWEKTHPVKVVNLLEHTAGFEDVQLGRMINPANKSIVGLAALDFHKSSLRSRWKPGERMSYSNPGYEVLGYLIEKFSGLSVKNFIDKNILLALGMNNSSIVINDASVNNLSTAYHFDGSGYNILPNYTLSSNGATGNLVSCADDMAKYLHSLLNNYQNLSIQLLPINLAADMDSIHSSLASKRGLQTGYALGNDLFPNNNKFTFRGHNGSGEGFNSWVFYNKTYGIGYAIANNSGENNWLISQIVERYITSRFHPMVIKESNENLDRFQAFTGYYAFANPKSDRWDFLQRIFNGVELTLSNNKLVLRNYQGRIDTLEYVNGNIFRSRSEIIPSFVLSRNEDGIPFLQGYANSLFFIRAAKVPIVMKQYLLYLGVISMLVSLIFGVVAIVLWAIKKISFRKLSMFCLPALATLSGLLSYRQLVITDEINKVAFSSINFTTVFIFLTSLFFGVFTIGSLFQLILYWKTILNKPIKILLTFIIMMLCYLTGIFLLEGCIGVSIWSL